jgi:hypothetical protein
MSQSTEICKNCERPFDQEYSFCPHCGQKSKDELTIGVLFYNTISNYFSFDARFLKSFFPLLFRPGYLAKKFIEGKRLLYLHPAQLYLFISVVFFFLFSFNVREQVRSVNDDFAKTMVKPIAIDSIIPEVKMDSLEMKEFKKVMKENQKFTGLTDAKIDSIADLTNQGNFNTSFGFNQKIIDSLIAIDVTDAEIYKEMGMDEDAGAFKRRLYAQMLKFYKNREGGSVLQAVYDTIPIAMFFLLPIFAIILKLLFYRRGGFAFHLVFSFYFFSFLFTVFSIILGLNFIWEIPDWLDWTIIFSTFVYLFLAIKNFYQQGYFWSFVKSSFATFIYMSFVIPIAIVIIGIISFMFY